QIAAPLDASLEEEPYTEEEVSDLDVLAEADEDDEDLMAEHGEADVSGGHVAAPEPYQPYETPPPADDFATRLDLGDDEEPPPSDDIDRDDAREFDAHVPAPIEDAGYREAPAPYAYQRARRASREPSTDYTLAASLGPSSMHFSPHETGEEFDEP